MAWNDNAHVCEEAPQAAAAVPESATPDALSQPLTRHECENAGMAWNDNAHVCEEAPQAAAAVPESATPDALSQPLTRHECENAGMAWNDNVHVCEEAPQATAAVPESEALDALSQPITKQECDEAGLSWDDMANVCGEASEQAMTLPDSNPIPSTVLINIDKASQKMTVSMDGVQQYEWSVSTGLRGYTTPSGTYTTRSMNKIWYSRQWDNAPMPHAVFFTKDGHAVHGTLEVKRLGKPASHGCVRLSPENAATLYALVEKTGLKNTQVVLAGSTPGGEGKVANKTRAKSSYRSRSRYENYYADSFPQRQRRGGFFRRLFDR